MRTLPTVSVILANYNHAHYLPETLESFLSQTHPAHEVIVVDDASRDRSCAIVEELQKKHSNLLLIRREKNSGGPMIPFRDGLNRATGDYVTFSAADDHVEPWFFEEALQFVSEHPEIALCCGDLSIFSDGPRPYQFRRQRYLLTDLPQIFTPEELAKTCLNTSFQIASQASIYKKEAILHFNAHDIALKGYSDFCMNYQIGFTYPIAYVPRPWASYRDLKQSFGRNLGWRERYQLCLKFLSKLESEPRAQRKYWVRSGILAHVGPAMAVCLLTKPKYWCFAPFYYPKRLPKIFRSWIRECLLHLGLLEKVKGLLGKR